MGKLKHENVVRAVDLPEKLSPQRGQPPALAMEYCEGGDLRKVWLNIITYYFIIKVMVFNLFMIRKIKLVFNLLMICKNKT